MQPSKPFLALLLVDDDPLVREVVRKTLENFGWVVLEARDPLEAASIASSATLPLRCIVARLNLPGVSGPELADEIARGSRPLPALYYSGAGPYDGRALGPRELFLPEPFGVADLMAKLSQVLWAGFEPPPAEAATGSCHVIKLYEDPRSLATTVAPFLAEGLRAGERVVVIATAPHWSAIEEGMVDRGVTPAVAKRAGRLAVFDAPATLERLGPGTPGDDERFAAFLASIGEGPSLGDRKPPLRGYGEMVDLLWQAGRLNDALDLEARWNRFLAGAHCKLLCGYHRSVIRGSNHAAFAKVADCHSHVVLA